MSSQPSAVDNNTNTGTVVITCVTTSSRTRRLTLHPPSGDNHLSENETPEDARAEEEIKIISIPSSTDSTVDLTDPNHPVNQPDFVYKGDSDYITDEEKKTDKL